MVFKPISLARSVLSKTFPYGYTQSLVAASQSSSASHNTHLPNFSHFTSSFQSSPYNASQAYQSDSSSWAYNNNRLDDDASDRGLDAYYAAWHKHHRSDDLCHPQLSRHVGRKASAILEPQTTAQITPDAKAAGATLPTREGGQPLHQCVSPSNNIDVKNILQLGLEHELPQNEGETFDRARAARKHVVNISGVSEAPFTKDEVRPQHPTIYKDTALSASSLPATDHYADYLTFLAEHQRLKEIPSFFESMLQSGAEPTAVAYNALLIAAVYLPAGKHQIVPKILDVYADMLNRRVKPNATTFAILIETLSARALDAHMTKRDLEKKSYRFSDSEKRDVFLFASDKAEHSILADDDSLSLAIRLFDISTSVNTNHTFPHETYRVLITACAKDGRIGEMLRIYGQMESQELTPSTEILVPMIEAFATEGDLRSVVECYEEYKSFVVAQTSEDGNIFRRDSEVYAAVVKAYGTCNDISGALRFSAEVADNLKFSPVLNDVSDAVATQGLIPMWLAKQYYTDALTHLDHISPQARISALEAIIIHASDNDDVNTASNAYDLIQLSDSQISITEASIALTAAYLRKQDFVTARHFWTRSMQQSLQFDHIEPAVLICNATVGTDAGSSVLNEVRQLFAHIRDVGAVGIARSEVRDRIDEAIHLISCKFLESALGPNVASSLELLHMFHENNTLSDALLGRLLLSIHPKEIVSQPTSVLEMLIHVQANFIINLPHIDDSHVAHFQNLVDTLALESPRSLRDAKHTFAMIDRTFRRIHQSDFANHWRKQSSNLAQRSPIHSQCSFTHRFTDITSALTLQGRVDSTDPYATLTDFKGSANILEELEKPHNLRSNDLNESLLKFRDMRRLGRHPRYITYAKLISAAAKERRLGLAHEILAIAKQDVPFLPNSLSVLRGWISILDAMIGACLTAGERLSAYGFHQELLNMGSVPSANTYGLYITTLKESTKTFDEATEAVAIFLQARNEGVEPTSFLYNALIGKLGKARRIDDCLFYFAEMRGAGIYPTSVTYGTVVNALCRVSDDRFAEQLFEEMESMPNYKPRPAPYNSLMQFYLTTKRNRPKVLLYYDRMREHKIVPTMHTYKLLIDTFATIEPLQLSAAEAVLVDMRRLGLEPEAVHYASLIHAKGCVMHDLKGARHLFESVMAKHHILPHASVYQALLESMVANHEVAGTEELLTQMSSENVSLTPYIANTLIHGWAIEKNIVKARFVYDSLGKEKREPSTYDAMIKAYLTVEDHESAIRVVQEALRCGYPAAVTNKMCDLVEGGGEFEIQRASS